MADGQNDGRERTEQPTARRRQQARDEGQVPRSGEIAVAAGIVVGALLLAKTSGHSFARVATETLQRSSAALAATEVTPLATVRLVQQVGVAVLLAWLPFALGVGAVVAGSQLAQTRGALSWQALTPKLSNLSPLKSLQRLFGLEGVLSVFKSAAKMVILGLVTWSVLSGHIGEFVVLARSGPAVTGGLIAGLTLKLAVTTGLALLALAGVDYAYQWFRHEKSLRMSRDEIMREHRETEGDPLIKARIRSIARSLSRRRMMQAVPTADVVVVNPTHVAVALRYDPSELPAPVVVAMGERRVAEKIRAIAEKAGVPIVQNIAVARALLATGAVGKPIPGPLYVAVAEILAWVHRRHGLRHAGGVA